MKKGFSLIELMIAVTVVGILASIAYPSYVEHVARARRSDGQAALLDLASRMENFFSDNNTYATATIATNPATDVLSANTSPEGFYTLSITAQNANSYTLQATPAGAQAGDACQSLTLNSVGNKGVTGGATKPASECW